MTRSSARRSPDLGLDAALDPDVALLRFDFQLGGDTWSVTTTPDGWRWLGRPACRSEMHRVSAGDHVAVTITAIDLAGNQSAPVTRDVTVRRAPAAYPACAQVRHSKCGMGAMGALLIGAAVIAILGVGLLLWAVVCWFRWSESRRLAVPEPVSLLVAERIARAVQRRSGMWAVIGLTGVPVVILWGAGLWAIASTIVACIGIRGFAIARTMLRLIEAGGAVTAETLGPSIIVCGPEDAARLDISPRELARAQRHAVPSSIAKRS